MPVPIRTVLALTSAVIKVCEQVVLGKLNNLVKEFTDPSQVAYGRNRRTDYDVLYVLENMYSLSEEKKTKNRQFFKTDIL